MSASSKIIQAAAGSGGGGISEPIVRTINAFLNTNENYTAYWNHFCFDSENNIYGCGRFSAGPNDLYVAKLNADLEVQWQRYNSSTSSSYSYGLGIVCDSTDSNVYVAGQIADGENDAAIWKFNTSDGATALNRNLRTTQTGRFYGIDLDSSDNPITVGLNSSVGILWKWNTSLSATAERRLDNGEGGSRYHSSVRYGSDGSIYVFSMDFYRSTIIKMNSGYGIQWKFEYEEGSVVAGSQQSMVLDSSDNIYFVGHVQSTTKNVVMKIDSSDGSVTWQKTIDTGVTEQYSTVDVNSDGELLVRAGYFVLKLDNDGNEIWQRKLVPSAGFYASSLGCCRFDNDGNVVMYTTAEGIGPCIVKAPTDGDWDGLMVSSGMFVDSSATIATGTQAKAIARGSWQSTGLQYSDASSSFTNSDATSFTENYSKFAISPSIKLVGSSAKANNGQTGSLSVAMPSGLQQDDFVVVFHHASSNSGVSTSVTSGWTRLLAITAGWSYDSTIEVYYKKMGATPDTEVVVDMSLTNSQDSHYFMTYAFRGVDTSTPWDVTYNADLHRYINVGTWLVDLPSMTAVTENALYLTGVTIAHIEGNLHFIKWSDENNATEIEGAHAMNDSYDVSGLTGIKLHTGSAFNPGAIETANFGKTDDADGSGVGVILALRPA